MSTLDKIVTAAAELLKRNAGSSISISELMIDAGLNRTLFHYYYTSINDCLLDALEHLLDNEKGAYKKVCRRELADEKSFIHKGGE